MKKLRVVSVISTERTVKILWAQQEMQLKLAWADGMVWCMPVFDNYDKAEEYCWWKEADIREVTVWDDYTL